jgi:hypothetical protein
LRQTAQGLDKSEKPEENEKAKVVPEVVRMSERKSWQTPELVIYGSVAELTQEKIENKQLGTGDDFATNITNA